MKPSKSIDFSLYCKRREIINGAHSKTAPTVSHGAVITSQKSTASWPITEEMIKQMNTVVICLAALK